MRCSLLKTLYGLIFFLKNNKQYTQNRPPACLVNAQTAVLCPAHIRDLRSQSAADRVVSLKGAEVHDSRLAEEKQRQTFFL